MSSEQIPSDDMMNDDAMMTDTTTTTTTTNNDCNNNDNNGTATTATEEEVEEDDDNNDDEEYDVTIVQQMLQYCTEGNLDKIQQLVHEHGIIYACQQYTVTGVSPLMIVSHYGYNTIVQYLLQVGNAPWNAIDRVGLCAGDYATNNEQWDTVNLLVDWATRSELILGTMERNIRNTIRSTINTTTTSIENNNNNTTTSNTTTSLQEDIPIQYQSSTKPDYLQHRLVYTDDGQALLDNDNDAVMMEWERPLMYAHAQILMESDTVEETNTNNINLNTSSTTTTSATRQRSVLNVGYGMGIIDNELQKYNPSLHIIIEPHPDVYQRMILDKWDTKPNVRICYGTWQTIIPQLIQEHIQIDSIFFDTYGEHSTDLEDFHILMIQLLSKNSNNNIGRYSYFNGLAPDNLFFHGVTCNVIQIQLNQLGLVGEFLPCAIQPNNDTVWDTNNIRRKYWHNRDTYYLPIFKWNTTNTNIASSSGTSSNVATDSTTTTESSLPALLEPSPMDQVITQQLQELHTKRQKKQQLLETSANSPEKKQRMTE